MNADEAAATISATLARLGVAEGALGPVGTTIPRAVPAPAPVIALPTLAIDRDDADLHARAELGRGGMGIVRLAEQRSLGRLVAMKTTLGDDEPTRRALLHEARTMGASNIRAWCPCTRWAWTRRASRCS